MIILYPLVMFMNFSIMTKAGVLWGRKRVMVIVWFMKVFLRVVCMSCEIERKVEKNEFSFMKKGNKHGSEKAIDVIY